MGNSFLGRTSAEIGAQRSLLQFGAVPAGVGADDQAEVFQSRWLPGVDLTVHTATAPKSFRADWTDGSTRIAVGFVAKGDAKAQVAVSATWRRRQR
jgi:hypothetical protein